MQSIRLPVLFFVVTFVSPVSKGATISDVFSSLGLDELTAQTQFGGGTPNYDSSSLNAYSQLSSTLTGAIASSSVTSAYTSAFDDGVGPGASATATGGGHFVLANSIGQVIEYSGDLIVRFSSIALVRAGDMEEGAGSIHGFAEANFSSNPGFSARTRLRTNITTPDTLLISGVLSGIPGLSVTTSIEHKHQRIISGGKVTSVNNGVGQVGLRSHVSAADSTDPSLNDMPGPSTSMAGIRISGFESPTITAIPDGTFVYFSDGSRFAVTPPAWLTDITVLDDNPFEEFVPEPNGSFIALLGILITMSLPEKHYGRNQSTKRS